MCCVCFISSFVTNLAFPSFFQPLKSTLEGVALTAAAAMGADVDAAGSILLPLLLSSVSQQALLLSRAELVTFGGRVGFQTSTAEFLKK